MAEPVYAGNDFLPLWKRFTVRYAFEVSSEEPARGHEAIGSGSGDVSLSVFGVCSRRSARARGLDLAMAESLSETQELLDTE